MPTNTLITSVKVTEESLRIWHTNCVLVKRLDKQYSTEFANVGAKIGRTISIRMPDRGPVRKGQVMNPAGVTEVYVPLQLTTQWGADISFSTAELATSIDKFSNRFLKPRLARLAAQMDQDFALGCVTGTFTNTGGPTVSMQQIYNRVGTPGTTPGTAGGSATGIAQYNVPMVYLNAGMVLNNYSAPVDEERYVVMNPAAHAQSANALAGIFNPPATISEIYKKGYLGEGQGFSYAMDQNMYTLTLGTRTASSSCTLQTAMVSGTATVVSQTGTGTVVAGDVFTVSGVYSVNPENQQSTGQLAQWTVVTALTLAGTADTITIFPTPVLTSSSVANGNCTTATGTFTGSSTGGAVSSPITFVGAASTSTPCNLAFHKEFATLGTADLEVPNGIDFGHRDDYDGISMRVIRAYDVGNDQLPCRIDILGGFQVLRPEWASVISG